MTAAAHYRKLVERAASSLDAMTAEDDVVRQFTAIHNLGSELEALLQSVEIRPEAIVFGLAIKEFQYSLYAAATGSYRHAHVSLRMFLELFSAGIFFSAYEIKLRCWMMSQDGSDISWSSLSNADSGIFSNSFIQAFSPAVTSHCQQYRTIATTTYRECSEFVHGNMQTQDLVSSALSYNSNGLSSWMERAEAAYLCILFSFQARYLPYLANAEKRLIEHVVVERLGHIPSIRQNFS